MLIRGGTVVDAGGMRRADVLIEGERIAAVGDGLEPGRDGDVIDATGAFVIPGAIDVHTHFALPVGSVRSADDFTSGTVAAACGGTTCVIDFAGAGREQWTEALDTWHERADHNSVVDFGLHLTVTDVPVDREQAAQRFRQFVERGVTSVKLYLAYPDRLMVDDATLARALAASVASGVRVMVHAEDGAEIERLKADALAGHRLQVSALTQVRPPSVEAAAVRRATAIARTEGAEVYVVHLSSAAGLDAIREARHDGAAVRAETCPQYLCLDQERLGDPEDGQDFVCSPPIRSAADRAALWAALASGDLDVISTDHCPFTRADRRHGTGHSPRWRDFTEIPGGLPGVETRLALAYQGVIRGLFTPQRWVELVAGAPARLFGLAHRKGRLEPGFDADAVVFDPEAHRTLRAAELHSRSDHNPYEGLEVTGWPALTIARGRVVAGDGEPADAEPGWGRYVYRKPMETKIAS